MKRITELVLFFVCVILFAAFPAAGAEKVILLDECKYASAESARAQWKPTEKDTPAVEVATAEKRTVLKLPCNFRANKRWCLIWQRSGEWDLSACRKIAMTITAEGDHPAMMMLYFRSGAGWYWYPWMHVPLGTNDITLPREAFSALMGKDKPAGWDKITAVRIGVVREGSSDRAILISNLRALVGKQDPTAEALESLGKVAGFSGVKELTRILHEW